MAGFEREILLAPDIVARTAAALVEDSEQRWMLSQSWAVRRSYVREVLDAGSSQVATRRWMLRQPDVVRESYIDAVLSTSADGPRPEVVWMLGARELHPRGARAPVAGSGR